MIGSMPSFYTVSFSLPSLPILAYFFLPATRWIVPSIPNIGLVTAEGGISFLTLKEKKKKEKKNHIEKAH